MGHVFVLRVVRVRDVSVWKGAQAHGLRGGEVHVLRVVGLWDVQPGAAREARARVRAGEVPVLRVVQLRVVRLLAQRDSRALRGRGDGRAGEGRGGAAQGKEKSEKRGGRAAVAEEGRVGGHGKNLVPWRGTYRNLGG